MDKIKPLFENDRKSYLRSLEYQKDYGEDLYPNTGTEEYHDYKPVIDFVERYIENVKKSPDHLLCVIKIIQMIQMEKFFVFIR